MLLTLCYLLQAALQGPASSEASDGQRASLAQILASRERSTAPAVEARITAMETKDGRPHVLKLQDHSVDTSLGMYIHSRWIPLCSGARPLLTGGDRRRLCLQQPILQQQNILPTVSSPRDAGQIQLYSTLRHNKHLCHAQRACCCAWGAAECTNGRVTLRRCAILRRRCGCCQPQRWRSFAAALAAHSRCCSRCRSARCARCVLQPHSVSC